MLSKKAGIGPLAVALAALCCGWPSQAHASGDVTLTAPESGAALADDGSIVLVVSQSVPQERFANFFLLFDGDDVTGLAGVDGRTVTFHPPQSLEPGQHTLRIVERTGDNAFNDLQKWAIRVNGRPGAQPAATEGQGQQAPEPEPAVTGVLQGQYNRLIADNLKDPDKIPPNTASAALTAKAQASGDGWQLESNLNGYAGPTARDNPDKDAVELGQYNVVLHSQLGQVTTTLTAGDYDAGLSNLLVDKYLRRGVTANFDLGTHFTITSFAQDPARTVGNSNVSGLDDDNRVEGAFVRYYPSDAYGKRVFGEAGYYGGKGLQGVPSSGLSAASTTQESGSGWLAALEGQTLDDKANLRGEFSEADFDDDGSGIVSSTTEDAWRARLQYAPLATLDPADGASQKWLLQANYQRFGTFYRSLANLNEPMDDERVTLTSRYTHDSLSFVSEGYVAQNNTDDIAALPTDDGYGVLAQFSVKPDHFNPKLDPTSLLGRSTFSWGGSFAGQSRADTPAGYVGTGNSQSTWIGNAGWTAVFDKYNVTLSHVYTGFDNRAIMGTSYVTNFSQLAVNWTPVPEVTVSPSAQTQFKKDSSGKSSQVFGGLDVASTLIPGKLTNTFHYSGLFDHNGPAEDEHSVFTEFDYRLREAARNRPGFTLALSGNYQRGNTAVTLTSPTTPSAARDENYKVYVSLKMDAPFGF